VAQGHERERLHLVEEGRFGCGILAHSAAIT
jgi:hypothetical protein